MAKKKDPQAKTEKPRDETDIMCDEIKDVVAKYVKRVPELDVLDALMDLAAEWDARQDELIDEQAGNDFDDDPDLASGQGFDDEDFDEESLPDEMLDDELGDVP